MLYAQPPPPPPAPAEPYCVLVAAFKSAPGDSNCVESPFVLSDEQFTPLFSNPPQPPFVPMAESPPVPPIEPKLGVLLS